MAYKKTNWQDTLRDAQGNVIQKGTPLNAQALGKIEDGIVQAEQKIDTEIQQVTTQLAQSEVKINKKIGDGTLAMMSDLSQEVKEAMTGGSVAVVGVGAVGKVNIQDQAVTGRNIEGYQVGKNLLDPTTFTPSTYINTSTNSVIASPNFDTSEFIPVNVGESYALRSCRTLGHFDINKNIVSSVDNPTVFTATQPYIRVSAYKADVSKTQLEKGSTVTAFEEFKAMLPDKIVPEYISKVATESKTKMLVNNLKNFEVYMNGDLSRLNYRLPIGLAAIQSLEIIGISPEIPVKLWILSRNRGSGWGYRFIFGKKENGVWSTLLDSQMGFSVTENVNGTTNVSYSGGGVTVNMRIRYDLIPDTLWISDGETITSEPLFIVSPRNVKLTSGNSGGGGTNVAPFNQSLNTTDSVRFANVSTQSIATDALEVSGAIPTGTLSSPPQGLLKGDLWADTTDSTSNPIVRIKL